MNDGDTVDLDTEDDWVCAEKIVQIASHVAEKRL